MGLDHIKIGFYQFQCFLLIVVIVISILLKTTNLDHKVSINEKRSLLIAYNAYTKPKGDPSKSLSIVLRSFSSANLSTLVGDLYRYNQSRYIKDWVI